jgi:cell fate (sporulation/competence/biofilm development) regulator YlbF (YheA/YmcA/DUF963 family)
VKIGVDFMTTQDVSDIEIASASVVKQAARDFAAALSETPQYQAFEQAARIFQTDEVAQRAQQEYEAKQQSLRGLLMLNAASAEEQQELERLRQAFFSQPSVVAYLQAQNELMALSQACADLLSQATGLNYSASCGSSCCG